MIASSRVLHFSVSSRRMVMKTLQDSKLVTVFLLSFPAVCVLLPSTLHDCCEYFSLPVWFNPSKGRIGIGITISATEESLIGDILGL